MALAIAVPALVLLYRQGAVAMGSTRTAATYQEAISRAQSRLDALTGTGLAAGEGEGDDGGGFAWQGRVVPLATGGRAREGVDPMRPGRAVLLGVTVRISWHMDGGERQVALATERVEMAPPDQP